MKVHINLNNINNELRKYEGKSILYMFVDKKRNDPNMVYIGKAIDSPLQKNQILVRTRSHLNKNIYPIDRELQNRKNEFKLYILLESDSSQLINKWEDLYQKRIMLLEKIYGIDLFYNKHAKTSQ
jgi:hypothetical protein